MDQMLIYDMKEKILKFIGEKNLVIFGAGVRGVRALDVFLKYDIPVVYFCDNNKKLHSADINGVKCISMEDLIDMKNDVFVMISIKNEEDCMQISTEMDTLRIKNICLNNYSEYRVLTFIGEYLYGINNNIFPMGHFYSPYPSMQETQKNEKRIFDKNKKMLDIDFNEEVQMKILCKMTKLYNDLPNWLENDPNCRYKVENDAYPIGDAIALHCMLRMLKPKKIIEVGSGYSSMASLDTNEMYFDNSIDLTFIEPYPQRLKSLLKETDDIHVMETNLQDVSTDMFEVLDENDILFIDSSHVSKVDSDVNYLFFEILPRLKSGVYIHLHDIFYPMEYPQVWIEQGIIWSEIYLLRAFLQNNKDYSIVYFQNMAQQKFTHVIEGKWDDRAMFHGCGLWLKKN